MQDQKSQSVVLLCPWGIDQGTLDTGGFTVLVRIYEVDMPAGLSGQTDGVDIWISNKLNEVQRRCTILHELVHIEQGHTKAQPEHVEMLVRYETARRLLPIELAGKCRGSSVREVADNFEVTPRVLMDRVASATAEELELGGCASCQLCPAAKFRFADALIPA